MMPDGGERLTHQSRHRSCQCILCGRGLSGDEWEQRGVHGRGGARRHGGGGAHVSSPLDSVGSEEQFGEGRGR